MIKKITTVSEESTARKKCRHYWIINAAAGPVSQAVCQFCGAKREFGNYLRDCLKVNVEEYQGWAEGKNYDRKERKPLEDIVSQLGGGDRNAVTAGI